MEYMSTRKGRCSPFIAFSYLAVLVSLAVFSKLLFEILFLPGRLMKFEVEGSQVSFLCDEATSLRATFFGNADTNMCVALLRLMG